MPRGRPREFDVDQALDRALRVFWRKGYEGTTLPDLTRAMGINRPSLYAAFGNKEGLFRKALDRYAEGPAAYVREALERADGTRRRRTAAGRDHRPGDRPAEPARVSHGAGCARVRRGGRIRPPGAGRRAGWRARLRYASASSVRSRTAICPSIRDPADLARYVVTVIQGMAVQAAGGASRAELRRVAALALRLAGVRQGKQARSPFG